MDKVGTSRTQNAAFCFISKGLKSLATQAQGLIKSSPLTFISQRAPGLPNQVTTTVNGLSSQAHEAFSETAQSISKVIFGEAQNTTTPWTEKTAQFNLNLISQIKSEPEPEFKSAPEGHDSFGAFRVGGYEPDAVERVKSESFEGTIETKDAATTLKKSLKAHPLFAPGVAMEKTKHLFKEEGEFIGTPKEIYQALTQDLTPEKKGVFDSLIKKFSDVLDAKEKNQMDEKNIAIAIGPSLFPDSGFVSDPNANMMDNYLAGQTFAEENTVRNTHLITQLASYAATQAPVVSEEPSASIPVLEEDLGLVRLEATPEAGRVFTDEGLKARIASLEAKENKSLKEIEPDKVYAALTEGLSGENKALFDGAVESLRGEAKSKEVNGKQPYEEMKALDAQLPRMSLVVQLIQTESIQNTPLGISDRSVEAFVTNKTLVDKLLRANS